MVRFLRRAKFETILIAGVPTLLLSAVATAQSDWKTDWEKSL